jgi:lysophospholipase
VPLLDLIDSPANPAPEGGVVARVRAADGLPIRVARWHPEGRARGTIVVVQGRAEYIEKYFETIGELLQRGFCVVSFDWRGQGLSGREIAHPRKGHIDDFLVYERDLEAIVDQTLTPFCPRPWFGLAHSMGASVLIQQAHGGRSPFERLVLLAPLIDIRGLRFPRAARLLADILDVLGLGGAFVPGGGGTSLQTRPFKGNRLTRDPVRYKRNGDVIVACPQIALGDPTIGWVGAAFRLIDEFEDPEYPRRVLTPILMFAAGADRVVSTPRIERFGHRLKAGAVIVLEQSEHEILSERDAIRDRFWAAFDAFIPGSRDEAEKLAAAHGSAI